MTVKGDARDERQSSWLNARARVRAGLAASTRPLQLAFAGFVLLHFAGQAYRAHTDSALPEAGFERAPGLVVALLLLLWLPFTVFGARHLSRSFSRARPAGPATTAAAAQDRALAVIEPIALAIVLLFGAVHGVRMAWPLLSGNLAEADLRQELVAELSSTWHGLPIHGIFYLCAVGAASFCAARLTLALLPAARPLVSRSVVSLAVLAYLLGSYAVIRCGSGSLLP
ncbi:MAG TPA: hypothetical protein VJV79_31145 [Polyangiaceae bacterium]|nr:hypothetical protein [Polyangiaceae bacterium]